MTECDITYRRQAENPEFIEYRPHTDRAKLFFSPYYATDGWYPFPDTEPDMEWLRDFQVHSSPGSETCADGFGRHIWP